MFFDFPSLFLWFTKVQFLRNRFSQLFSKY